MVMVNFFGNLFVFVMMIKKISKHQGQWCILSRGNIALIALSVRFVVFGLCDVEAPGSERILVVTLSVFLVGSTVHLFVRINI